MCEKTFQRTTAPPMSSPLGGPGGRPVSRDARARGSPAGAAALLASDVFVTDICGGAPVRTQRDGLWNVADLKDVDLTKPDAGAAFQAVSAGIRDADVVVERGYSLALATDDGGAAARLLTRCMRTLRPGMFIANAGNRRSAHAKTAEAIQRWHVACASGDIRADSVALFDQSKLQEMGIEPARMCYRVGLVVYGLVRDEIEAWADALRPDGDGELACAPSHPPLLLAPLRRAHKTVRGLYVLAARCDTATSGPWWCAAYAKCGTTSSAWAWAS